MLKMDDGLYYSARDENVRRVLEIGEPKPERPRSIFSPFSRTQQYLIVVVCTPAEYKQVLLESLMKENGKLPHVAFARNETTYPVLASLAQDSSSDRISPLCLH